MKNVANLDTDVKGTDIMERDTIEENIMEEATIEEVIKDAVVEGTTEDVHADIISTCVDNTTDGESSNLKKRRSKS